MNLKLISPCTLLFLLFICRPDLSNCIYPPVKSGFKYDPQEQLLPQPWEVVSNHESGPETETEDTWAAQMPDYSSTSHRNDRTHTSKKQDSSEDIKYLIIDIDKKESTAHLEYAQDQSEGSELFIAKENRYIYKVVQGNELLWKATKGKLAIGVSYKEIRGKEPLVNVFYKNDKSESKTHTHKHTHESGRKRTQTPTDTLQGRTEKVARYSSQSHQSTDHRSGEKPRHSGSQSHSHSQSHSQSRSHSHSSDKHVHWQDSRGPKTLDYTSNDDSHPAETSRTSPRQSTSTHSHTHSTHARQSRASTHTFQDTYLKPINNSVRPKRKYLPKSEFVDITLEPKRNQVSPAQGAANASGVNVEVKTQQPVSTHQSTPSTPMEVVEVGSNLPTGQPSYPRAVQLPIQKPGAPKESKEDRKRRKIQELMDQINQMNTEFKQLNEQMKSTAMGSSVDLSTITNLVSVDGSSASPGVLSVGASGLSSPQKADSSANLSGTVPTHEAAKQEEVAVLSDGNASRPVAAEEDANAGEEIILSDDGETIVGEVIHLSGPEETQVSETISISRGNAQHSDVSGLDMLSSINITDARSSDVSSAPTTVPTSSPVEPMASGQTHRRSSSDQSSSDAESKRSVSTKSGSGSSSSEEPRAPHKEPESDGAPVYLKPANPFTDITALPITVIDNPNKSKDVPSTNSVEFSADGSSDESVDGSQVVGAQVHEFELGSDSSSDGQLSDDSRRISELNSFDSVVVDESRSAGSPLFVSKGLSPRSAGSTIPDADLDYQPSTHVPPRNSYSEGQIRRRLTRSRSLGSLDSLEIHSFDDSKWSLRLGDKSFSGQGPVVVTEEFDWVNQPISIIDGAQPKTESEPVVKPVLNDLYPSGSAGSDVHGKREQTEPIGNLYPSGAAASNVPEVSKSAEKTAAPPVQQPVATPTTQTQVTHVKPAEATPVQKPVTGSMIATTPVSDLLCAVPECFKAQVQQTPVTSGQASSGVKVGAAPLTDFSRTAGSVSPALASQGAIPKTTSLPSDSASVVSKQSSGDGTSGSSGSKIRKIKIYTLNDDGSTTENDTTKYNFAETSATHTYTFHAGVKCVKVKGGKRSWEYDADSNSKYPMKVVYNIASKTVRIDFGTDYALLSSLYS